MNDEHLDIADALDPARFVRQHSTLDQALRTHLKPPQLSATFRSQVWQRVAAERAAMARTATLPKAMGAGLRARLALQCASIGAIGLAAALACWAVWPALGRMPAISDAAAVTVIMTFSGSVVLLGLQRLGLFRALGELGA
jgi:hypothetical protein